MKYWSTSSRSPSVHLRLFSFVLAVAVASTQPVKVASVGFDGVGVDASLLALLAEHLAQRVARPGVARVITRQDMITVLGFERQKQLLGCGDNSSNCMAELAGALGVDFLLAGDVARLSKKRLTATVKLLDAATGRAVFSRELRAASEEQLVHQLEQAGDDVVAELRRWQAKRSAAEPVVAAPLPVVPEPVTKPTPVIAATAAPARRLNLLPAWPTFAGVAVGVGGVIFLVRANQELAALTALANDPSVVADPVGRGATLVSEGKRDTLLGTVMAAAGAAAMVAGLIWWWLDPWRQGEVAVSLLPTLGGGIVGATGVWP